MAWRETSCSAHLRWCCRTGASGTGLRTLKKDNTGYDLRHLFIGAEGTLGIITAAVLKLAPRPQVVEAAWIGLASPEAALDLLQMAQKSFGHSVTGFELMPRLLFRFRAETPARCP